MGINASEEPRRKNGTDKGRHDKPGHRARQWRITALTRAVVSREKTGNNSDGKSWEKY
jgi:hypothetical protein